MIRNITGGKTADSSCPEHKTDNAYYVHDVAGHSDKSMSINMHGVSIYQVHQFTRVKQHVYLQIMAEGIDILGKQHKFHFMFCYNVHLITKYKMYPKSIPTN
jgi:hypothetical protein